MRRDLLDEALVTKLSASDSLFTTRQAAALQGPPIGQLAVARHGRQVARPRLPVEATDGQHLSRGDDPVAGLDDPDPEIEVLGPDQLRAEAADLVHDTPRRDHADERVGLQEPRQRDLRGEADDVHVRVRTEPLLPTSVSLES